MPGAHALFEDQPSEVMITDAFSGGSAALNSGVHRVGELDLFAVAGKPTLHAVLCEAVDGAAAGVFLSATAQEVASLPTLLAASSLSMVDFMRRAPRAVSPERDDLPALLLLKLRLWVPCSSGNTRSIFVEAWNKAGREWYCGWGVCHVKWGGSDVRNSLSLSDGPNGCPGNLQSTGGAEWPLYR